MRERLYRRKQSLGDTPIERSLLLRRSFSEIRLSADTAITLCYGGSKEAPTLATVKEQTPEGEERVMERGRKRNRGDREGEGRGENRRRARQETQSAKQDFQSQPVIRCGISIVHLRAGGTEGGIRCGGRKRHEGVKERKKTRAPERGGKKKTTLIA